MSPHALCRAPRGHHMFLHLPRASASASARFEIICLSFLCLCELIYCFSGLSWRGWRETRDGRYRPAASAFNM